MLSGRRAPKRPEKEISGPRKKPRRRKGVELSCVTAQPQTSAAAPEFYPPESSPEINADVGETEARAHTTDSADNPASAPSVPWSKVDVTPSHQGQGSGNHRRRRKIEKSQGPR